MCHLGKEGFDMVLTNEVERIFQDARFMQEQAVRQLAEGEVRDAAEKSWCAVVRATDAMVLAVTNVEPRAAGKRMEVLRKLRGYDEGYFKPVHVIYGNLLSFLHSGCFYDGHCDPPEAIAAEIADTWDYIDNVASLANRFADGIVLAGWNDRT